MKQETIQKIYMFAIMIGVVLIMAFIIHVLAKEETIEPADGLVGAKIKEEHKLKAPKEKIKQSKVIDYKECTEWEEPLGGEATSTEAVCLTLVDKKMVKYDYVSDVEVPAEDGEDITRRTKNAKFFRKEVLMGAEGGSTQVWEGRFYAGSPFEKEDDGKWYQVETATTTVEAFLEQTK